MTEAGWADRLWHDIRSSTRLLRKNTALTALILVVLSLGIGGNAAIFSLLDSVVLRRVPVSDPERLVLLEPQFGGQLGIISYPVYRDLSALQQVFSDLVASRDYLAEPLRMRTASTDPVRPIRGGAVSANYFNALGLTPAAGRFFLANEDDPRAPARVVVVGYEFWQRQLGGAAAAVGQTVTINEEPFTVIGVAPRGFSGISISTSLEVWIPLTHFRSPQLLTGREGTFFRVFGRLEENVTAAQAETAMTLLYRQLLAPDLPSGDPRFRPDAFRIAVQPGDKGFAFFRESLSRTLLLVAAMGAVLLIVVYVNLAGLLSLRVVARQQELAVRQALGASRLRIVQQLLIENLVVAMAGGVLGLLVATWVSDLLLNFIATEIALHSGFDRFVPADLEFRLDRRILAFTMGVAVLAAASMAVAPALLLGRTNLIVVLKERSAARGLAVGPRRIPVGNILVAAQVALCVILLVGAGLMVRTVANLRAVDPGFDPANVLVIDVDVTGTGRTDAALTELERDLHERLNRLPGVRAASLSWVSLFSDSDLRMGVLAEGATEPVSVRLDAVSPGYFQSVGMRLLAGRGFTTADTEAAVAVAVVNEAFARTRFPDGGAIGRRLFLSRDRGTNGREIVGIVNDAKYNDLRSDTRQMIYLPIVQLPLAQPRSIQVRAIGPPLALVGPVRQILQETDRDIVVTEAKTLAEQVDRTVVRERLLATLATAFAVGAVVLAALGLYTVLGYHVRQHLKEIGVRLALGSDRRRVMWLVARNALLQVGVGLAIGVPLALSLSRSTERLLFGVTSTDMPTAVGATFLVLSVAILTAYFPARRAAQVDPIVTLRTE